MIVETLTAKLGIGMIWKLVSENCWASKRVGNSFYRKPQLPIC